MGGRGAYVHQNPECLDRAVRRGGLARAFRARVASAPNRIDGEGPASGGTTDTSPMEAVRRHRHPLDSE
jgi:hypothetical protein